MSLLRYLAYKHGWEDGANSGRWQDRYPVDSELEGIYAEAWMDGSVARVNALRCYARRLGVHAGGFTIG